MEEFTVEEEREGRGGSYLLIFCSPTLMNMNQRIWHAGEIWCELGGGGREGFRQFQFHFKLIS